jgi:hypothetical protein
MRSGLIPAAVAGDERTWWHRNLLLLHGRNLSWLKLLLSGNWLLLLRWSRGLLGDRGRYRRIFGRFPTTMNHFFISRLWLSLHVWKGMRFLGYRSVRPSILIESAEVSHHRGGSARGFTLIALRLQWLLFLKLQCCSLESTLNPTPHTFISQVPHMPGPHLHLSLIYT